MIYKKHDLTPFDRAPKIYSLFRIKTEHVIFFISRHKLILNKIIV